MAGEVKLGKKAAEEVIDLLKQAKSGDQLEAVASKTGLDVEILDEVTKKGIGKGGVEKGKDLLKSVVERLGGTIESVQTEVNTLLGRTRDVGGGQVPPSAKGAVEMTGPVDTRKGKGFTFRPKPLLLPPGKETRPPRVSPEFAKEEITGFVPEISETGFRLKTEIPKDKALVPVSPRMSKLSETAQQGLVPVSGTYKQTPDIFDGPYVFGRGVRKTPAGEILEKPIEEPFPTKAQIRELKTKEAAVAGRKGELETTAPGTAAEAEYADLAEAGIPFNLNIAKEAKRAAKRAGLGLGVVGIASGFSKQADAPTAIAAAQVDKIDDVKGLADKAEAQGAVTPEQKAVAEQQIAQVAKASESLEKMLLKEYQRDKARIELMQLTETIMNGLVTAIGANALLNRGSPYAVDFSKGPKTDWAGEFDRLQKDFNTQMNALNEKYKLEAQEKREAEREARAESRFQRRLELDQQRLEAQKERQGQVAGTAAERAAEKAAAIKDKAFAELSGALAALKEKSTPITTKQVVANATKLGIPKEEIDLLVSETTGKGALNLAEEEKVAEILEKYRPGQQAAPAAAPSDAEAKRRRLEELRAKKSGG